ncbi:uncharacterized protein AC631_01552 [Debaryomyces fabryi]|uniref:Pre-mRNA-processing factor 19 n=1 Tax=Debaryomyces fabryi TaxID=58627 RepID=A0A0V1Q2H0_9ASCO|nr:uncharacterized protein AC631_01552 [Debaryomyces fabryi]KSA02663.1 hypothetical protein AC631_01552 [Debaryomyces fabryi]CUM45677.1 unnamed protein product [Debaryomyces fabryi]
MICSISGEAPKEPVISPKSGLIFERRLIENYISTSGKDPVNDEDLTIEELVPINSVTSAIVPPKPPSFNSIPSLLSTFQNEWDSLALEVFALRKQLHKAREELSAALYHHDAAVRVAAKAIKERDEARVALQQLAVSIGKDEPMDDVVAESTSNGEAKTSAQIPVEIINQARDELFQLHKSQKPTLPITPEQNITVDFIANHAQPYKKADNSFLNASEKILLIGSSTGSVAVYDFKNPGKNNITKITHKGSVTALNQITYKDEQVPIIAYKEKLVVKDNKTIFNHSHDGEIFQVVSHPTLTNLFILLSRDGTWSLNDLEGMAVLFRSSEAKNISCGDIHVDGALLGTGTKNGEVIIYNLTTGQSVSNIKSKYLNIKKLLFASNGYWLLVSSSNDENESCLDIIDLRKNNTIHSINFSHELIDFAIDPSSSVIITYDSRNVISLHRFIKKGKKWLDNLSEKNIEDSNSPLLSLDILSTANDEEFESTGEMRVVGVTQNSSILEFQLAYS